MKVRIIYYATLQILLIAGLAFLQAIDRSMGDNLYYLAMLGALAAGVLHIILMNRLHFPQPVQPFGFRFQLTVMIVLISAILILASYRLKGLDMQFLTFIIAYIVPYLLWHALLLYQETETRSNAPKD
jgi:glucan phosphoethanolaminetransferase (alkaline phosphatase superfamily)